jgi:ribosomal protein S18 acetylase RimI-like enzyme
MNVVVVPTGLEHIESFGECVGEVARERRFLAVVDAFSVEQNALWVAVNRARGNPLFVAIDLDADARRVVGWCEVRRETLPGRAHFGTLGVGLRAPYRGKGLGRKLMTATISVAWAMGFERIELWVRARNANALALYRSLGFVEEGRRQDAVRLDDGPEDEIMMALFAPGSRTTDKAGGQ